MQQSYVYIMSSKPNGAIYVGVTSNIVKRVWQHKTEMCDGFTKKYNVRQLVYFEIHQDISEAIIREKRIKKWRRNWKCQLIEKSNPQWRDLYNDIIGLADPL